MGFQRVYIIGPRACGKTTIGKALAQALGWDFYDTDAIIIRNAGKSVADIVAEHGWDGFRNKESQALQEVSAYANRIIATGGGMVLREENCTFMQQQGVVFFLSAPVSVLVDRLRADPLEAQRPSLTGKTLAEEVQAVWAERKDLYSAVASYHVDSTFPVVDLVKNMVELLERDSN